MTTIVLVVLFISQLLTFYFLVILNSKISRYKEIEKRQEAIIREMDDAISAYLVEVKDENDRLIQELKMQSESKKVVSNEHQVTENRRSLELEKTGAATKETEANPKFEPEQVKMNTEEKPSERIIDVPKIVPKTIATTAYKKQMPQMQQPVKQVESVAIENESSTNLSPFEQEVVGYHKLGLSIEEIAKKTQKGNKEIELLIKFHA